MSRYLILLALFAPLVLAAEELRIPAERVQQELGNGQWTLLDTRPAEEYQFGHIQGAINFPIALTYRNQAVNGQIVQPDKMQELLRERGIDIDSKVIVYDDGSLLDAARLFWTLEVYGLSRVRVMDHGYDYWRKMNFPVSRKKPGTRPSQYVATINHNRLASKFSTLLATRNSGKLIIDARPRSAYIGKESVAKRFGHIPKAINIPANHNFVKDGEVMRIKPIDEIKLLYSGVPKKKRVIVYCAIGRASSANYLALRELGLDVANYDASWKEWGNDLNLPVEK